MAEAGKEPQGGAMARLAGWFDSRLGLSYPLLRPVPQYSINPFYWLGALAVVAFVIEGVTGMMMALYYVPNPTLAYATTSYIFEKVSYGRFLETIHLYTAYAMIFLAVAHLMRGYFVSVHKKPREAMWMIGMLMGFVTLGFGFTGYLLPWTVVSKSATDVGIGLIAALPPGMSSFLNFLLVGAGGDATVLLRFFDLHVLVLPVALLALLLVKMYMLEAHGVSEPSGDPSAVPEAKRKSIPFFPDVSFYLLELAAVFGAVMLLISVVFPLSLSPQYTPEAAAATVAQPDWYFLWIYQILKIAAFEANGPLGTYGLPTALALVTLVFIALLVLPFLDRGEGRSIANRMKYVTLGAIFVAEIVVLSVWGNFTPGLAISDEAAALVIGGTALLVAVISAGAYRVFHRALRMGGGAPKSGVDLPSRSAAVWTAGTFALLAGSGAIAIGSSANFAASLLTGGQNAATVGSFFLSIGSLLLVLVGTAYLIYRLDLGIGRIRRRVKAFEVGWKN